MLSQRGFSNLSHRSFHNKIPKIWENNEKKRGWLSMEEDRVFRKISNFFDGKKKPVTFSKKCVNHRMKNLSFFLDETKSGGMNKREKGKY